MPYATLKAIRLSPADLDAKTAKALEDAGALFMDAAKAVQMSWDGDRTDLVRKDFQKVARNLGGRSYGPFNTIILALHAQRMDHHVPVYLSKDELSTFNRKATREGKPTVTLDGSDGVCVFTRRLCLVNDADATTRELNKFTDTKDMDPETSRLDVTYSAKRVFNIDSTDMRDARPDEYDRITNPRLFNTVVGGQVSITDVDDIVSGGKWLCDINVGDDEPHYNVRTRTIAVNKDVMGTDKAAYYHDLFHNMAHSTGDNGCMDRFFSDQEPMDYPREDTAADLFAMATCMSYGIARKAIDDIHRWNFMYNKDVYTKDRIHGIMMFVDIIHDIVKDMVPTLGSRRQVVTG